MKYILCGLPSWFSGRVSACQCRRCRRCWFNPWRGEWQPTQAFLLGESHGQRSPAGYSPGSCKELDMTWRLNNNNNALIFLFKYNIHMEKCICYNMQNFQKMEHTCIANSQINKHIKSSPEVLYSLPITNLLQR